MLAIPRTGRELKLRGRDLDFETVCELESVAVGEKRTGSERASVVVLVNISTGRSRGGCLFSIASGNVAVLVQPVLTNGPGTSLGSCRSL